MPCGSVTRDYDGILFRFVDCDIWYVGMYVLDICCGIGIEALSLEVTKAVCRIRLASNSVDSSPMSAKPNVEGVLQLFEISA